MKYGSEYYKKVIETVSKPEWPPGDVAQALLAAHERCQMLEATIHDSAKFVIPGERDTSGAFLEMLAKKDRRVQELEKAVKDHLQEMELVGIPKVEQLQSELDALKKRNEEIEAALAESRKQIEAISQDRRECIKDLEAALSAATIALEGLSNHEYNSVQRIVKEALSQPTIVHFRKIQDAKDKVIEAVRQNIRRLDEIGDADFDIVAEVLEELERAERE